MPLSQANLQMISTVLNVPVEEISGAISNENEVSLDLKLNGKVYKPDEIETIKTDSFKRGSEIRTKDLAKVLGIELAEGEHKGDISIIAGKLKSSLESVYEEKYKNQTPPEELENAVRKSLEWEQKYNKLKETYDRKETEVAEWSTKYSALENNIASEKRDNLILSSLPEKIKQDRGDALIIIKNILTENKDESGNVTYLKNGQPILDGMGNPEKLENIVKDIAEEKGWIKGSGMNGHDQNHDGSGLPSGLSTEEAVKYLESKNIEPMSQKGSELFSKITKSV